MNFSTTWVSPSGLLKLFTKAIVSSSMKVTSSLQIEQAPIMAAQTMSSIFLYIPHNTLPLPARQVPIKSLQLKNKLSHQLDNFVALFERLLHPQMELQSGMPSFYGPISVLVCMRKLSMTLHPSWHLSMPLRFIVLLECLLISLPPFHEKCWKVNPIFSCTQMNTFDKWKEKQKMGCGTSTCNGLLLVFLGKRKSTLAIHSLYLV